MTETGYDHSVIHLSDLKEVPLRHNGISYQKYNADMVLCVMTKQQTASIGGFIKRIQSRTSSSEECGSSRIR